MTKTARSLHLALPFLSLVLGALAPLGCSSKTNAAAPVDAGTDASSTGAELAFTGSITCTDNVSPPSVSTAPMVLKQVQACTFHGPAATTAANRLDLTFAYAGTGAARDALEAKINGFTGKGDFATGLEETDTGTWVRANGYNEQPSADGSHSTPGGTSAGDAACHGACTISISDASVTTAAVGGTGRLKGSITCTQLAAAGEGCVTCVVTPAKIEFDIAGCLRGD